MIWRVLLEPCVVYVWSKLFGKNVEKGIYIHIYFYLL
jgi:hypothetical protein